MCLRDSILVWGFNALNGGGGENKRILNSSNSKKMLMNDLRAPSDL